VASFFFASGGKHSSGERKYGVYRSFRLLHKRVQQVVYGHAPEHPHAPQPKRA